MQLKGLVRFFTILLIIYSLYQLSFTWFVRNHEKKLEKIAHNYVNANYQTAAQKYPSNKDSQEVYQEKLTQFYNDRLTRLKDSTKDETITYGITGAISYQKAKEEELNLGLDLQGGMNVTMEVEMSGLLQTLANNSKEPNFLKALENADKRKGNSDANFITLFVEEFKKLSPNTPLASLFATANRESLKVTDNDAKVTRFLQDQAKAAFDNTARLITTRIDKFGVAQPSINPDPAKQIISVELPGVQDKERVRKNLQASANLQFWEVYNISELWPNLQKADEIYFAQQSGKAAKDSSAQKDSAAVAAAPKADSAAVATTDTAKKLQDQLKELASKDKNTPKADAANNQQEELKKHIWGLLVPAVDQQGNLADYGIIGQVNIKDTAEVRAMLTAPALKSQFPSEIAWMYGTPEKVGNKKSNMVALYAIKTYGRDKAKLEGEHVTNAGADYDQAGKTNVSLEMDAIGSRIWADMTRANKGRHIAIVVDNQVYSAPVVNDAIEGGRSSISGSFSAEEAKDLANILKIGKLPAPAKIVSDETVGPTLGEAAIKGGLMSFTISFAVIFILMLIYYNTSGWVANIALILNLLFTVGVLAGLGATLTAPGIAGLVLTIGMAVDSNVIIYERIKEELTKGKSYISAINDGYNRSLAPVLDGHVTTLITAFILYYFGLGPVKGFATTQILGLLLSLFCGILVSRWVTDWFTNKNHHLKYFTSLSRSIFKHSAFKFIEFRKVAYAISVVILLLSIGTIFHGFDYGVEFNGGRSYRVDFGKKVDVEKVRDDVQAAFDNENPFIKTVGDASALDITTSYLITDPNTTKADSVVVHKLYSGLKNHLPQGTTFEQFDTQYKLGTKKVLPTISDDLKRGAVTATVLAILAIFVYIFLRFRDWRYSLGTIFSLLHDALVTLIVFSYARDWVPFPLEIDQHFIAAILTVIGFSMNDTVVVFDRIREDGKLYPNLDQKTLVNKAINDTLSRTIMTSFTVFVTVLILFIFGGEAVRGFAFAMLIGVVTGVYSSIFVAAPVLVDLRGGLKRSKSAAVKVQPESH
ncbi:protein translocase subunit SecDF [Niabella beijingensis]|uniref:protein translocase subunit SecDF n=1 Tax=Niabella beijingensis TaxID=2872700 RepID=UPI001CBE2F55|nr:protein translocase subunit SecDF [Niabella beijingensis]MBZ4190990.1 protein translocase subunit SecDF [Niabella beijingensis]